MRLSIAEVRALIRDVIAEALLPYDRQRAAHISNKIHTLNDEIPSATATRQADLRKLIGQQRAELGELVATVARELGESDQDVQGLLNTLKNITAMLRVPGGHRLTDLPDATHRSPVATGVRRPSDRITAMHRGDFTR